MTDRQARIVTQLKNITTTVADAFRTHVKNTGGDAKLSVDRIIKAAIDADFSGIIECSPEFWILYGYATAYNERVRQAIKEAIAANELPLTPFERILLERSLDISHDYAPYYKKWLSEMVASPAAKYIKKELEKDAPAFLEWIHTQGFDHPYTVITGKVVESRKDLQQQPYAEFFANELKPVVMSFEKMLTELQQFMVTPEEKVVYANMEAYKTALEQIELEQSLQANVELDKIWMDNPFWIQIVHDSESHYADPLGVKIIPDFSVRFLDPTHEASNQTAVTKQQELIAYYEPSPSEVAQTGMSPLRNSQAGIYYLPFVTGMSLHFKFSGQSLPNRPEVKKAKGVKIYLDYDASAVRTEQSKELFCRLFHDKSDLASYISTKEALISHVIPHEFGHIICNFEDYQPHVSTLHSQQLEELRADLTALTALAVAHEAGTVTNKEMIASVINYLAHDLRRLVNWDSTAVRGYRNSMVHVFSLAEKTGVLSLTNGIVSFAGDDVQKVEKFLGAARESFTTILAALDSHNVKALDQLLIEIHEYENSPLITNLREKANQLQETITQG